MHAPTPFRRPTRDALPAPSGRRAALVLVTTLLGSACLGMFPADPVVVGRRAYRATILVRGGSFDTDSSAVLQSTLADCGPAALATLLGTLGVSPPPLERLRALAGTSRSGTSFAGLSEAARHLGVPNRIARLDHATLTRRTTPLIAWVDRGHFVTVVPHASDSVLILDPLAGAYRITVPRFARFWSGEALIPESPRLGAGPRPNTPSVPGGTS